VSCDSGRDALAPVLARAIWEEKKEMKKLTTAAIGAACLVLGAGGATLYTHADTGPAIFEIYEYNVMDEGAYKAALPEAIKFVKDNGGEYLAGGFNKAKLLHGTQAVGNRFVVIRYPNEAAQMKAQTDGLKAWIEKNAPEARDIAVQAWETK
jgi:uncharacterized protein (DUF1330 family)